MISPQSYTKAWILGIRKTYPRRDPILIEKMIMALHLVESLKLSGLDFIFKGGTSLLLILDSPQRFSIDVDILVSDRNELESHFEDVIQQGVFTRFEEDKRKSELPKKHFKFYFQSVVQGNESHILLDILFQKNPYHSLSDVEIQSPLIAIEGRATKVLCPSIECLLGDKLTAFAPHTTGILLGGDKELEIAKQLFDVAILFDHCHDIKSIRTTFNQIAKQELSYRGIEKYSTEDVLQDILDISISIGTRGTTSSKDEYAEILSGIKKMAGFAFSDTYSPDSAILSASKAAYLSTLILKEADQIERFASDLDMSNWAIKDPNYSKLNKLKKTSPEAFYYFCKALNLTGVN
jgi:hypothetical protein